MKRKIALASDHGGFDLKNSIKMHIEANGFECVDFGTNNTESCDYSDYALPACQAVLDGSCELALLFCGTGVGISIAANKIRGIRACCCSDAFSAEMTRMHNNANALCLGGRVVGTGLAETLVDLFLNTSFEGGRHQRRVDKVAQLEASQTNC